MITICVPSTPERHGRLEQLLKSISEHTQDIQHRVLVYENNDGGWVPAVYNLLDGISGYVILLGSDVIVQAGWLSTLYNTFITKFPNGDGVAEPFNEIHGGNLCQHPFAKVETIKKYLYAGYTHQYSDQEFTDRAELDNKLIYVPEAKIQHNHFVNGKAEMDETYKTVFNRQTVQKDQELYNIRKHNGYK